MFIFLGGNRGRLQGDGCPARSANDPYADGRHRRLPRSYRKRVQRSKRKRTGKFIEIKWKLDFLTFHFQICTVVPLILLRK